MEMKRRVSVTSLSSENNLLKFRLNALMTTFSQNVSKLFSKLKLVTDNLLINSY